MAQLTFILSVLALLITTVGFIYTYTVGKRQKLQGEIDTEINEKIQEHPYLRNPVFLAWLIAAGLATATIIYLAISYY